MKKTTLFIFFSLLSGLNPLISQSTKNDLLNTSKELIQNECVANDQTRKMILSLDSLSAVKDIPETEFINIINRTGEIFRQQGKMIPIIELYLKTISFYKQIATISEEQTEALVSLYISLGASHEEIGLWSHAMEFYFEALHLAEEHNLEQSQAKIYNNIGATYYNRNEWKKAEYYLRKAIEINQKYEIKQELFNNYNNLAGIYINNKDYDQALDCALFAIQQIDYKRNTDLYYFMQTNIASIYLLKKDYQIALSYLTNSKKYQEKQTFSPDLAQTYLSLSSVYENIGKADSARWYIEKAVWQAKQLNNKHIESRIQKEVADYYEKSGEQNKAYRALKEAYLINDSISTVDNQQKINNLETMYITEKKIKDNELQIKNITLQKLTSDRLWIISASLALLLIIVVLYLINYLKHKEKARKNEELLLIQQNALYEKEKEIQKQKEIELNDTIDKKNRELTSYTLFMIRNNELISEMKDELKLLLLGLNSKESQHKERIRELINRVNQQNATNSWEEFSYYFEKVHPSFYQNLEKQCPELTTKEKRLCAFLVLGLSSKEISAITFKEVRSVESARNRLRKKLGVNQEDNLTDFLHTAVAVNNDSYLTI